jgi:hypothetical protein
MSKPYFRQVPNFDYVSRNPGETYISEYIPVKNLFKRGKLREDIFGNLSFFEKYSIVGDERPDNVANKFYGDSTLDWVVLLANNILNIQSEWPINQNIFDKVMLEKYGSYDNLYNIHHYETEEIKNSLSITVLKGGIQISQTWKTNGNFIEAINSIISDISASGKTVTVSTTNNVPASVGDQVTIDGVSEIEYNGKFTITSVIEKGFTYELIQEPIISEPVISTSGKEQVIYTIPENSLNSGNAYYYEYWDSGLGYPVFIPSTEFVREITNYEYETNLNEEKRNIFILKPRYLNIVFNDLDELMPYKRGSQQFVTENLKRGDNIRLYQ